MKFKMKLIAASLSMVTLSASAWIPDEKTVLRDCQIVNKKSSKVLDKEKFEQNGGYFHIWQNNNTSNQRFSLTYSKQYSNGYAWYISAQHSGQCIHVGSDTVGSRAMQYNCPTWATWILDGHTLNNGFYIIRDPFNTNMVLDVKAPSVNNGDDVHLWTYYGGDSQKWRILGCKDLDGNLVSPAIY